MARSATIFGAQGAQGIQGIQGVAGAAGADAPLPEFLLADHVAPGLGAINWTVLNDIGTIAMLANEVWEAIWHIVFTGADVSSGAPWRLQGPAAPSYGLVTYQGDTSTVGTRVTVARIGAANIFTSSTSIFGANAFTGQLSITAVIYNGANPGNLTLEFDPQGAVNHTIVRGSWRRKRKIA